jgi:exosome complex component RRP41
MDGHMTQEEFERAIELAKGGCMKIYELQKEALRRRYSVAADEAMLREETREV